MTFKLGTMVDLSMAYVLMLVSMTLTLMQGHNGLACDKNQRWFISTTIMHARLNCVSHDLDFENSYMAWPSCPLFKVSYQHSYCLPGSFKFNFPKCLQSSTVKCVLSSDPQFLLVGIYNSDLQPLSFSFSRPLPSFSSSFYRNISLKRLICIKIHADYL